MPIFVAIAFTAGLPALALIFKSKKLNSILILATAAVLMWAFYWGFIWVLVIGHNNYDDFLFLGVRDNNFLVMLSSAIILAALSYLTKGMLKPAAPEEPETIATPEKAPVPHGTDAPAITLAVMPKTGEAAGTVSGQFSFLLTISEEELAGVFAKALTKLQQHPETQQPPEESDERHMSSLARSVGSIASSEPAHEETKNPDQKPEEKHPQQEVPMVQHAQR